MLEYIFQKAYSKIQNKLKNGEDLVFNLKVRSRALDLQTLQSRCRYANLAMMPKILT